MINLISPNFATPFNSVSHNGHWTLPSHQPSSRSDRNPGFPVQFDQGFAKSKSNSPHTAHEARTASCSAANDVKNSDSAPLINSVVNHVKSHPPLSFSLSSAGSHNSGIFNEYDGPQLECPADGNECPTDGNSLRNTGQSPRPRGTTSDAREHLDPQSTQESSSEISVKSTFDIQTTNRTDSLKPTLSPDSSNADLSPSSGSHEVHRPLDPTGVVLTRELQGIVNDALALYESLRSAEFLSSRSSEVSTLSVTPFSRPQTKRSVRSHWTPFFLMQLILSTSI